MHWGFPLLVATYIRYSRSAAYEKRTASGLPESVSVRVPVLKPLRCDSNQLQQGGICRRDNVVRSAL